MQIHIAKVNGILWSGEAESVTVPGIEGELTALPHHVPLVTNLKPGRLIVKQNGEEVFTHDVERGVFEVTAESATVLL
jgi:F-type H+-transporting ATPase subunit epsilon